VAVVVAHHKPTCWGCVNATALIFRMCVICKGRFSFFHFSHLLQLTFSVKSGGGKQTERKLIDDRGRRSPRPPRAIVSQAGGAWAHMYVGGWVRVGVCGVCLPPPPPPLLLQ
jgi:hypothetical protein